MTTAATFTYNACGTPAARTGTATTILGYASAYTGPNTGLLSLRARYYDPQTGQFMSSDPLEAVTQQPCSYANDNPINDTDQLGLSGWVTGIGPNVGPNILPTPGQGWNWTKTAASDTASSVGTAVSNHYGQIAEVGAAALCITEVLTPVGCLAATGVAFGVAAAQNVNSACFSSATETIDVLGTIPGVLVGGAGAVGALEGDGVGQLATKGIAAYAGVGSQVGAAAYDANAPCGCR